MNSGAPRPDHATLRVMAARKRISKSQYENLAAFRYALRQFLHFSEAAAQGAGITPQQHQALLAIKGFPGRDTVTVGERLRLRPHSAVELLDRLVDLKLVARTPSTTDRRQVRVHLTSRGERILDRLSSAHHEQLRRIGSRLSALLERLGGGKT
jgi:DNA-binding MarR family transcriptional regulator